MSNETGEKGVETADKATGLKMTIIGIGDVKSDGKTVRSPGGVELVFSGPGFHDIQGACGTGKTTVLSCLEWATTGEADRKPAVSYERHVPPQEQILGAKRKVEVAPVGQVLLPGIGGKQAGFKVSETGMIRTFETVDVDVIDGDAFIDLTRPRGEGGDFRQRNRFKAFSKLCGMKVKPADLAPDFTDLLTYLPSGDLVDVAASVTDTLRAARLKIVGSKSEAGELPALEAKLNALNFQISNAAVTADTPTLTEAQSVLSDARDAYNATVASAKARAEQEAWRNQVAASIAPRPDVEASHRRLCEATARHQDADAAATRCDDEAPTAYNVDTYEQRAKEAREALARRERAVESIKQQIALLQQQLVDEESRLIELREAVNVAEVALSEAIAGNEVRAAWRARRSELAAVAAEASRDLTRASQEHARLEVEAAAWDAQQQKFEHPLSGATAEDVAKAADLLARAQEAVDNAKVAEALKVQTAQRDEVQAKVDALTQRAASLATAASTGVAERSQEILKSSGVDGWKITDGMVAAKHPTKGAWVNIESLSTGELDRLALSLLLANKTKGAKSYTILLLRQEIGQGMDDGIKKELGALAREKGIYIITASMISGKPALDIVTY